MGIIPLSLLQVYFSKFVEIPPAPRQSPLRMACITADGGVLIGAVLAVSIAVAGPALRDAVAVLALEAGGLAGVVYC